MKGKRILKQKFFYGVLIAVAIIGLMVYGKFRDERQKAVLLSEEEVATEQKAVSPEAVVVHVAGAVVQPGVYHLKADARVIDAIEAAGGMTEDADEGMLNLAAALSDGQKITVYHIGEVEQSENGQSGNLVNINSASKEKLMTLPGIGEVLAENIIAYREKNGPFPSKEAIKEVNRIGDKLYQQIEEAITI